MDLSPLISGQQFLFLFTVPDCSFVCFAFNLMFIVLVISCFLGSFRSLCFFVGFANVQFFCLFVCLFCFLSVLLFASVFDLLLFLFLLLLHPLFYV